MNLIRLASQRIWMHEYGRSSMSSLPCPHYSDDRFSIHHNWYMKCIIRIHESNRRVLVIDQASNLITKRAPEEYST